MANMLHSLYEEVQRLSNLLLVTVFSQTLLSFVRSHLMALSFLTARHCSTGLVLFLYYLCTL